jgi:Bacterial Ig-like domain (group 3)/FG-GAP-like repeat
VRRLFLFSALLLMLGTLPILATAQNTATTTVTADPATITVGGTVGLAATVQPNAGSSTGKTIARPAGTITFLDGSTPLSSAPIALAPNSYASATFPQTFGTLDPTLTAQMISSLVGEVTGDLNGDGVPDLLIYNYLSSQYSVQTFTSNGKGGYNVSAVQAFSFPASASYPYVVNTPQLIDVNGDGKPDLLCGLLVAYGNGDGTFAQTVPVSFLSSGFVGSYAADLNGDGMTDIVAVPVIPQSSVGIDQLQFSVTVFINQGRGSFTSTGTFPIAPLAFGSPYFLSPYVVDVNGDGKPDLITQTQTLAFGRGVGLQSVDVLVGNGDGTFGTYMPVSVPDPPDYGGGLSAYGTGYGDVNGDGKPDLILTLASIDADLNAMVLLGNGDGTFQAPLYLALHTPANGVGIPSYETPSAVVQDLNLDGKQDLIFGNGQVALGNGDGTFALSPPLFPFQLSENPARYFSFPLVQVALPGSLEPSLVYLLPTVTPPAASVFTPQTSSSTTLNASTLSVGAHTITARYSGDANYAADTSAGVAISVNQATSTIAATSSANPSFAGQSVTLTANVTSAGPTPTGNVTFTSGSTTLASVALSGGSASYTSSSFTTVGTQTITVSYAGDANTQASSTSLSQVVNAAFNTAPGGSGSTTLTVKAGQVVSAPINVTGAAGFSGPVTFACSGLPANSSCSFSPATIAASGTTVVSTLLSVSTTTSTTTSHLRPGPGAYGLAFAGLLFFWPARRNRHRVWAILLCAIAFATLGLNGCSNGSGPSPVAQTAAGSYNFTVTANSGSLQAQTTYTLVVQ